MRVRKANQPAKSSAVTSTKRITRAIPDYFIRSLPEAFGFS